MKLMLLCSVVFFIVNSSSAQISWGAEMEVAPSSYGYNIPRVVLDGSGNPVVSWGDGNQNFLVSTWNGSSFSTPLELNSTMNALEGTNFGPEIASHGDTIYGVFKQNPPTTGNIYVVRSTDGGVSFDPPVQVDNIGTDLSEFVHISTDDIGNPIVAFNRFDPSWGAARWAFAKSANFGATFSPDIVATGWSGSGNPACECCPAGVASSGSTTIVAYRDNLSNVRDMWAGISNDGGTSFTAGMGIDQTGWTIMSCPTSGPDIQIIGDTLYSTYMSQSSGTALVYQNKSSISSATGSVGTEITNTFAGLSNQNYPRMSISGTKGVIVWQQSVSGAIQIVLSLNNSIDGIFPSSYDVVAPTTGVHPDVVMSGNKIHVVWRDYSSGTVKYRQGTIGTAGMYNLSSDKGELVKITDLMGRETMYKPNTPLIFIYSNGTQERVFKMK